MEWLRKIRNEKNLTLSKVSLDTNISLPHLSLIENGKRHPSISVAKKIADYLEFDWTLFFKNKS